MNKTKNVETIRLSEKTKNVMKCRALFSEFEDELSRILDEEDFQKFDSVRDNMEKVLSELLVSSIQESTDLTEFRQM